MKTSDSPELRNLLVKLLPGLTIEHIASPSGQRVVYFSRFVSPAPATRISWKDIVVKASEQLNPRQIAYLQKEIQILKSIHSKHYPKLLFHDVFTTDSQSGEPLKNRLFVTIEERIDAAPLTKCRSQFTNEERVSFLLVGLVNGLQLLWSRPERLVHRDLKPDNILIRPDQTVTIIDLGIVREEGAVGITEDAALYGPCSPPYASPEQANNDKRNISFKSDFFSLGTIAYELLAGENPYYIPKADSRDEVLTKVRM